MNRDKGGEINPWPALAGRIEEGVHRLAVRVYYEDTDFTGNVYHANYLKYCERGRSDFLRLLDIHHHELADDPQALSFVVRRIEADFLAPARIDDTLEVSTRMRAVTGARLTIEQSVSRSDKLLFQAVVTAALVDGSGRPIRLPSAMRNAISSLTRN